MNWGTTSLDLKRLVRNRWTTAAGATACLLLGSSHAAHAVYSQAELRAAESPREAKIRELGQEEITQLRITLGRRVPGHRKADLYFRLAEIYMEGYRAAFLVEGKAHEKRIEKGMTDKFIDRSYSRPYLKAGVQACKEIVGFGIPFEKMDQVYYFLGFNHGELEQQKESAFYYHELIKRYPSSIFAAPAYKELADYSYHAAHYHEAAPYYEAAIQRFEAAKRPPLQHKLAWCYYRGKQYERAVEMLKATEIATRPGNGAKEYSQLHDEVLRDLAVFLTETGRAQEAIAYFKDVSGDDKLYSSLLEKLGATFERNAEPDKAVVVYQNLINSQPGTPEAFRVAVKIIELEINRKGYTQALARLRKLRVPEKRDLETQAVFQNLRILIRKNATSLHQSYRTKKNRADLELAEGFYQGYQDPLLKAADPNHESIEIMMYLAEVKHDLGKSHDEAELYRQIVASKDTKFSKQASLLWLGSLVNALKQDAKDHAAKADPKGDLSPLEKQFVEAAELLKEASPDSNEAKESSLRVAELLAGYHRHVPDAIKRIKEILSRWPGSEQALTGAQLWIQLVEDSHSGNAQTEALVPVMEELRANKALMAADVQSRKGKMTKYFEQLDKKLQVSTIARFEKDKNFHSAAQGYEEFAAQTNDMAIAEKAYANAVANYLKAPTHSDAPWAPVQKLTETWVKRFPKSTKAVDSLRSVATVALIRGQFEVSAQIFEKLGTVYHDADSLDLAARVFQGAGNMERALGVWDKYLELYPKNPNVWRISLAMAELFESHEKDPEASRVYKKCVLGPDPFLSECQTRLADLYARNQDLEKAKALYDKVSKSKSGSPFVAYARYKLAEMIETQPSFLPLKLPEANLQKAVAQRIAFLGPLTQAYRSALQAGGPWAVTALNRLATWVHQFAVDVDHVEPPASAQSDPKVLERFRKSLAKVSQPMLDQAKNAWMEAYTKAVEQGLFSPVLWEIGDHLADLRVPTPGRAQGLHGGFLLAGAAKETPASADGGKSEVSVMQQVQTKLDQNANNQKAWVEYGDALWEEKKPALAKIAYERALSLKPKDPASLNNLGFMLVLDEEDWVKVTQASELFRQALEADEFFTEAKFNQAKLFNYYRMFSKAKPLWLQLGRSKSASYAEDARIGLAISTQGASAGGATDAEKKFDGLKLSEFAENYHRAARAYAHGTGKDPLKECLSEIKGVNASKLVGFEKASAERLRKVCEKGGG